LSSYRTNQEQKQETIVPESDKGDNGQQRIFFHVYEGHNSKESEVNVR